MKEMTADEIEAEWLKQHKEQVFGFHFSPSDVTKQLIIRQRQSAYNFAHKKKSDKNVEEDETCTQQGK